MANSPDFPTTANSGSSQLLAVVYWLVVILPLSWGVYKTAHNAIPLFHVTSATAAAATPGAASTPPEK